MENVFQVLQCTEKSFLFLFNFVPQQVPSSLFKFDFVKLIHWFTISVPVHILPVFCQLLLRNRKFSSKSLFWNERTQHADTRSNPNGHIFVNSLSIRRRNSTGKGCRDFIDFERRIHVEIMTSIRRANFDVDSIFKIEQISTSFLRAFFSTWVFLCRFDVESM